MRVRLYPYNETTNREFLYLIQRQSFYSANGRCGPRQVCCRRPPAPLNVAGSSSNYVSNGQCGKRNTHGITGRIKTPAYVDGDSEFGKYLR